MMTNLASLATLTILIFLGVIWFAKKCAQEQTKNHDESIDNFIINYNAGRNKRDYQKHKWYEL